jgi:hypothetical protein
MACAPSFTDADIISIKRSISEEYRYRPGLQSIDDIELIRESSRKLTGYLKATFQGDIKVTVPCSATMDEDRKFLWTCESR